MLILSGIAILVTIGVYGLVGLIVKLDDIGFWLEKSSAIARGIGKSLLVVAPWLMKTLSVVGTPQCSPVGGGIIVHGVASLHHMIEHFASGRSGSRCDPAHTA